MTHRPTTDVSWSALRRAHGPDAAMIGLAPARDRRRGHLPWTMLLAGGLLLALAGHARAACHYGSGAAATIGFTPPATIPVSPDTTVGTVLWTSAPIAPANPLVLDCSGTNGSGIANGAGPTPTSGTLFPTGIPWLSYQILYPDATHPLQPDPNEPVQGGSGATVTFSVGYALQLVVTGPVTSGGTLSGQLGVWQMAYATCSEYNPAGNCPNSRWVEGTQPLATFTTSSVVFVLPTCNIAADPTVVTLPTVYASGFTGAGSVSGQTPFDLRITCTGKTDLDITLATGNPQTGATGVIAAGGTGFARDVGVQILDGSGNPVAFGTPLSAGQTANGTFSVPFYARYYQTGAYASAGKVIATASYTLTYP